MEVSDATTKKPNIGKTGVHLLYHKNSEYRTLTQEQKDKLREWRPNNPNIPRAGAKKPRNEASKKPKSCYTSSKQQGLLMYHGGHGYWNHGENG